MSMLNGHACMYTTKKWKSFRSQRHVEIMKLGKMLTMEMNFYVTLTSETR
jgi:hypothetical protein